MDNRGRGATRPWQWLLVIVLSLLSGGAMALGLGQIRVLSGPGQPLLAEIPIISNEPGELDLAQARLASPETFRRVGLQPPAGLVRDLQFEIAADAQGRAVVRVTSQAPVEVPALAFLIEVDWGQGRLVREYSAVVAAPSTVAIEAPAIQGAQALPADVIVDEPAAGVVEPAAVTTAEPAPAPPAPTPVPAPRAAPVPAAASVAPVAAGDVLATVQRGQTLSGIAAGIRRQGYTLDQAMLALLHANPEAFIDGNINRLRAGVVLRMPDQEAFSSNDAAAAAALVREQVAQWRQSSRPVLQPAVGTTAQAADARATAQASPAAAAPAEARLEIAPAVPADGATSTESGLGAGGEGDMLANEQLRQAREDLAARDSEVQELRSRLDELEKLQQQQQKLIELKDTELAAAQQRLAQIQQDPPGQDAQGGVPVWAWAGLGLLVAAAVVFWLARRPKPLPIPVAPAPRGGGWDPASLATPVPAAVEPEPAPAEYPREPEPATEAAAVAPPADAATASAPAWHVDEAPAPGLGPLNPAPAGRERLELAIAYLDLGDVETARTLLQEVAAGQDPAARDEAVQLLREIG